jgi:hypothetical protein
MIHVTVLHARLPAGPCPPALARLLDRLPYAKRLEVARRDPVGIHASLAGIALVLRGVATLRHGPVDADRLQFPAGGKPYLRGGPSFSVSHGATMVGAAICSACEVGFDLEELDPGSRERDAGWAQLARWTATEAVLKAAARGLREARDVELGESLGDGRVGGMSFHLVPVEVAPDVVAHLATDVPVGQVSVEEVEASALVF